MLAGYVTATTVHLARVRMHAGEVQFMDRKRFANDEFKDFVSILETYRSKIDKDVSVACLGIAGTVIDNEVIQSNLPWPVDASTIEKEFGLKRVKVINDLVATAKGIFELPPEKFYTIKDGHISRTGNIGLLAAGSGLGEAVIVWDGDRYIKCASEGGHSPFAPGSQLECELWEWLVTDLGRVVVEDVVSYRGLKNIYEFVTYRHGEDQADWYTNADRPEAAIMEQALSGQDEMAVRTLDLFTDCYATEAASLALKGITTGGIYLGGMIAPQIATSLDQGRFRQRFQQPGRLSNLLVDIPVMVVMDDSTALLGAACEALGL